MKKEDLLKSKTIKLLIPLAVVLGAITIFKSGISFGQWLYVLLH
jgi:hypothetical protein